MPLCVLGVLGGVQELRVGRESRVAGTTSRLTRSDDVSFAKASAPRSERIEALPKDEAFWEHTDRLMVRR